MTDLVSAVSVDKLVTKSRSVKKKPAVLCANNVSRIFPVFKNGFRRGRINLHEDTAPAKRELNIDLSLISDLNRQL